MLAAHLVERGAALLVDVRPPGLGVERLRVERLGVERLRVERLGRLAGLPEARLQLFRAGVGACLELGLEPGPAPLHRAIRGEASRRAGDPRDQALHAADATLAAASCLVIAPSIPERRQQSGPTQTMGRLEGRYRDL